MPGDLFWRMGIKSSGVSYDASDDISSLSVDQHEGVPDALNATLADPFKVLGHAIQEGMDVEVELGTDDDHAVIFRGRIYRVDGDFPTEQTPTIRLAAYDPSMRMGLKKRNRVWSDMTLTSIVKAVAAPYFDTVSVSLVGDPKFAGNGLRQQEETDLAFLRRLAETYGCVLYAAVGDKSDSFQFLAQHLVMTAKPAVSLCYGRTDVPNRLLKFESNADASQLELPRVLSGIDGATGKPTELTTTKLLDAAPSDDSFFNENLAAFAAQAPDKASKLSALIASASASQVALRADLGDAVREATATFQTEEDQSALAKNQFSTSLAGMRGSGGAVGIRTLTAQTTVDIGDVGGRFSGVWFLSSVKHLLDEQGYRSEFECRR